MHETTMKEELGAQYKILIFINYTLVETTEEVNDKHNGTSSL